MEMAPMLKMLVVPFGHFKALFKKLKHAVSMCVRNYYSVIEQNVYFAQFQMQL